jgi:hypothetical protein
MYGVVCSICFANLNIHEQKEKLKINGLKIIDNQGVMIYLDGKRIRKNCISFY